MQPHRPHPDTFDLAPELDSDEAMIANEIVRATLNLCSGEPPARMALIAAQASAQIVGSVMAEVSRNTRDVNSWMVENESLRVFRQSTSRMYVHAMPEIAAGRSLRNIGLDVVDRVIADTARAGEIT